MALPALPPVPANVPVLADNPLNVCVAPVENFRITLERFWAEVT